jgi:hypothetical protein
MCISSWAKRNSNKYTTTVMPITGYVTPSPAGKVHECDLNPVGHVEGERVDLRVEGANQREEKKAHKGHMDRYQGKQTPINSICDKSAAD